MNHFFNTTIATLIIIIIWIVTYFAQPCFHHTSRPNQQKPIGTDDEMVILNAFKMYDSNATGFINSKLFVFTFIPYLLFLFYYHSIFSIASHLFS